MINNTTISEVVKRLVETYKPLEIYLFGSYAWGHPTEESDLDLLVVVDQSLEKNYKRPLLGHAALRELMISKDIIVFTKKEFEDRCNDETTLSFKIKKEGKRVYAKA